VSDAYRPDETADDGFVALTEKITRESDFRCTSYKDKCVRRRIAVRMRARGAGTYDQYARLLDSDHEEYGHLIDALTINVTKFFRNPSAYAAIAQHVVPELWRGSERIRIWSAGSASGEEAYSLAALFYEHACAHDQLMRIGRVSVIGSDIDRASLDAAHNATYLPSSFTDTDPELVERLFPELGERRTVIPAVRAMARFERRDLLQDPPPAGTFDLIACRNVIIYLDRESRESLMDMLFDSLRPGGYLVMGHVETFTGRERRSLIPVAARERIYRKTS
jgi:chemotaxis methyl-accepting protein methylase